MVSAMTNQEAFILVANLDRPEAAQASRPRHSLVVAYANNALGHVVWQIDSNNVSVASGALLTGS